MSQYVDYLNTVSNSILHYPVLVTLPIGIIGNVFSLYIYIRPNLNKKTNTGFLYAVLCILNIIFMLYAVFVFRSNEMFGYIVILPCGVVNYLLRITFCFVPWMQVIISFDRFILVVYPLRKNILSKKWILCLIMLGTLAFIATANMPNLLSYMINNNIIINYNPCVQTNEARAAANIISILLRAYIPFTLMLVFDIIVFKKLRQSKRRVGVILMDQQRQPGQISNKEYNFIISTIFIDLTFVVFYTPVSIYVTATVVNLYVRWDSIVTAGFNLFYNSAILFAYLYSALMFFIFLIFNRFFRHEVFNILRLHKIFPNLTQTTERA